MPTNQDIAGLEQKIKQMQLQNESKKGDVRIDAIRSAGSQNRSVATTGTQRNKLNPKLQRFLINVEDFRVSKLK